MSKWADRERGFEIIRTGGFLNDDARHNAALWHAVNVALNAALGIDPDERQKPTVATDTALSDRLNELVKEHGEAAGVMSPDWQGGWEDGYDRGKAERACASPHHVYYISNGSGPTT
jgi:hypothetical protein